MDDAQVLTGLRQVGFIGHDEQPILMSSHTLYPAYVIMDSAYGQARDTILNWLNQQHIYSIGRYGAWMYDSMEGAIIQGRETARRLNAEL